MDKAAPKPQLATLLAVAIGGAIGALARVYLPWPTLSGIPAVADPLATILVNLLGSLVLGFVTGFTVNRRWPEPVVKGLTVGVLGSFTTMSALAVIISIILLDLGPHGVNSLPSALEVMFSLGVLMGILALTTVITVLSYRFGLQISANS